MKRGNGDAKARSSLPETTRLNVTEEGTNVDGDVTQHMLTSLSKQAAGSLEVFSNGMIKLVIRRLPPTISRSNLFSCIDHHFSNQYTWCSFHPGNARRKKCSTAYLNFRRTDDVVKFFECFHGHIFVTEKGTQFRTVVDYAPSQKISKPRAPKDFRDGTIYKDPEYLEFLKCIVNPLENFHGNSDIQLEMEEDKPSDIVITPLMEVVRQQRAADSTTKDSTTSVQIKNQGHPLANAPNIRKRSSRNKMSIKNVSKKLIAQPSKPTTRSVSQTSDDLAGSINKFQQSQKETKSCDPVLEDELTAKGNASREICERRRRADNMDHFPQYHTMRRYHTHSKNISAEKRVWVAKPSSKS